MIEIETMSICDSMFFNAGFRRGKYYYYRKMGSIFQCVVLGRGRIDCYDDEIFLVILPYWTARISRIEAWPSFESAFTHRDTFISEAHINWPNYGIDISNEVYAYSGVKRYAENGEPKNINAKVLEPYVRDKLIPFLDTVFDEKSYKEAMASLNRHCRVFEEVIILECSNKNSTTPALEWLGKMVEIDSNSKKAIAKAVYNNSSAEQLKQFGLCSFEEAFRDAEVAVETTHKMFFDKLEKTVKSGNYQWINSFLSVERKASTAFFEKFFDISFKCT